MKRLSLALAGCLMVLAGAAAAQRSDITIGMQLEPPNLDPTAGAAAAIDEVVYANVFEGLTRFGPDGEVLPALAESWEIAPDGLSWVFNLREGVSFHDGLPFTAEDVVFSFDRAMAEGSTNAQKQLFDGINEVTAIDDTTLEIGLDVPKGSLLSNLAWGDAVIVSPASAEGNATNPIGTGPFRFSQWVQGDRIELVRNEEYWGEKPALGKVTFKFISDPTAAFAAMMAGDLDAFPVFPAPENLAQFEADPRFSVIVGSTEGETILAMNNARPPFDDIRVRRAVAHAIDRQAVIDGAMFGYGTPIGSHFAPHNPAYEDLTAKSAYDPELSRALLAEAGHPEGFSTTLTLPPPSYARRGGEIVASQLRAVGIEVEIVNVEWAQWLEQVFTSKDFGLTIVSHTEPMDIGIYARKDYYFGNDDPVMRALMLGLDATSDETERTAILRAAQERVADQQVNAFLFQLAKSGVADARIEGLWANMPTQANDMTGVHWKE
ncbi:MAG TPA: ABC transporter substrate-binding protein [Amaricoccus sp.]|uniref:ABC transporter substrate-binding protein n=1 Tax=Amaricoccus sp. TaxID=1872485 RepID=UPI002CEC83EA|nr:ABC transporter substrate-binding protein [Amaricoccus sp.]HMQ94893.1 ABC transporter substrate-binding protein [Amaricoccus sp.]HMR52024.1 ABC transporter substrate-binding protein [Amaricoccus sp.]HMR60616.1 ABC transporter substrate-binding protein [Amaricoccus sp.]HMT98826.1 ABC transporter substrate-binding protein [Amaricoccus sp.]